MEEWWPGAGRWGERGVTASRYKVPVFRWWKCSGISSEDAQFWDYSKNHWIKHLKKTNKNFQHLNSAWRMNSLESPTSQHLVSLWLTISGNPMVFILSFSVRVGVSSLAKGPAVTRCPPYSSRALGGLVPAAAIFYLERQRTRLSKPFLICSQMSSQPWGRA